MASQHQVLFLNTGGGAGVSAIFESSTTGAFSVAPGKSDGARDISFSTSEGVVTLNCVPCYKIPDDSKHTAVVIVFDASKPTGLAEAAKMCEKLKEEKNLIVIGNKHDLIKESKKMNNDFRELLKITPQAHLMFTSAESMYNLINLWTELIRKVKGNEAVTLVAPLLAMP